MCVPHKYLVGLNYIHRLLYFKWFVSAVCAIKTLQSEDKCAKSATLRQEIDASLSYRPDTAAWLTNRCNQGCGGHGGRGSRAKGPGVHVDLHLCAPIRTAMQHESKRVSTTSRTPPSGNRRRSAPVVFFDTPHDAR